VQYFLKVLEHNSIIINNKKYGTVWVNIQSQGRKHHCNFLFIYSFSFSDDICFWVHYYSL